MKRVRLLPVAAIIAILGVVGIFMTGMVSCSTPGTPPPLPPASTLPVDGLKSVDVTYMLRGYCIAGSRIKDKQALGGFGPSDNLPWSVPPALNGRGEVFLHAAIDEPMPFAGLKGFALYLVNGTGSRASFSASDSRMSILREARDPAGNWKPVEYLPSSWCGNSYHKVLIDPGQCWRFAVPQYAGTVETRFRFALSIDSGKTLYSNEFPGRINPQQFTVKQGHAPTGIMDPYNE